MKKMMAMLLCMAMLLSCVPAISFAEEAGVKSIAGFEQYYQGGEVINTLTPHADSHYDSVENAGVVVTTYVKEKTTEGKPVAMYVINTLTERIGTDSDEEIIQSLLDRDFIVQVYDFKNQAFSKTPQLEWYLQAILMEVNKRKLYTYGNNRLVDQIYIIPSGYNIERNVPYFNYAQGAADGTLDFIVDIWNTDFRAAWGSRKITFPDGTTKLVRDITATTIDDCVNTDGSPLDLNLYLDIMYPTNPEKEVPVMCQAASSQSTGAGLASEARPYNAGFLFNGYAGVVYEHCYVPMSRDDHYGYYTGNTHQSPFTLYYYTGVKTQTAAIRRVRYLANTEPEKYKFDLDAFGAYGHSKASNVHMLGVPEPEKQPEMYFYKGHHGEATGEQPWSTYEEGELAGEKIPSNTQMVYTSNGGGYDVYFDETHAPTFATCGEADGNGVSTFLAGVVNQSRAVGAPCLHFSMPKLGHTQVAGYSPKFDADMYKSLFDFTDYWLKDSNAVCSYIYPINKATDVPTNSTITVKFTAPVSQVEIEKVKVTESKSGEAVSGIWSADMANTTWIFTPDKLTGGKNYTVTVPKSIQAQNGKTLREGKTATIRTCYETAFDSVAISGQNGSLKLVQNENDAYALFDGQDFANSTTASLRIKVKDDGANNVLVYALNEIDEENLTASDVGELIGKMHIAGEGYYDLDITEFTKQLTKNDMVGFVFKTEKKAEEIVICDNDFEAALPEGVSGELSTEESNGGSQSYKGRGFYSDKLLFPSGITESDYGRKFHISADVKLTEDRGLIARVAEKKTTLATTDYNDTTRVNLRPGTEEWTTVEFDYRVDNPNYCRSDVKKEKISIYTTGDTLTGSFSTAADLGRRAGDVEMLYLDNLKITETVSDIELAEAELITHPAVTNDIAPNRAAYVESGDEKDTSFEGSQYLTVNGRKSGYYLDSTKKVYAKLDLSSYYANMPAKITLQVSAGSGIVNVYGLNSADDWSADTINYYNAPANDRFGDGIDISRAYGAGAIAKMVITGSGEYSIDVTDYAIAMKAAGKDEATLVFALQSESYDERELVFEDFNDGSVSLPLTVSGGRHANELTNEQSYNPEADENAEETGGYSYMLISKEPGGRFVLNLLDYANLNESDIGRKFTLTYWMKAERAGTIRNAMIPWGDTAYNKNIYLTDQTVSADDVGVWKQYTYDFSITEELLENKQLCINFQHQASGDFTAYYDDIKLIEHPRGAIRFDIAEAETLDGGYLYKKNAWTTVSEAISYKGTTSPSTTMSISSEENHTPGSFDSTSFLSNGVSSSAQYYFKKTLSDDNSITADMIGKTYDISFWIKSSASGNFNVGMANGTDREGASKWADVQVCQIKQAEIDTWKQIKYSITITQEHVDANRGYFGFYMYSSAMGAGQVYIDDFVSKERMSDGTDGEITAPYTYSVSQWPTDGSPTSALTFQGISGWSTKLTNSDADNHTAGDDNTALSLNAIGSSGQLYFYKTLSEDNAITENMIGKTYDISFWIKSAASGTFKIGMSNKITGGADNTSKWEYPTSVNISASEVNTWKEVNLSVTVTQTMYDNQRSGLGFYVYSTALGKAQMYIDDLNVKEQVTFADDGRMTILGATEIAAIDSMGKTDVIGLDKNSDAAGVRKVYLEFIGENTNTQKAVLNIYIDDAAGQEFGVYALSEGSLPGYITYSNAPGSNADESMNEDSIYGGTALAEFKALSGGTYQIDVTDYVKNKADGQYVFALATSESGGVRYYHQNFESYRFTEEVDYTTDGSVGVNGEAAVEGTKLQILNVFGSGNKSVSAEETYVISAKASDGVCMALADRTGDLVADSVYAQNGVIQLVYTASAEDVQNEISTLIFTGESGFTVDDVMVETESKINIGASSLTIETADVEIDTTDTVTVNVSVIGGDSVSINGENKGATTTSQVYRGDVLNMVADGAGVFMYWIDSASNTILSYDEAYSYTVGTDRSLAAVYADESEIFVSFTSMANKVVASGVSGSIETPKDPYVYGYKFSGWYIGNEKQELTVGDAVYADENTEYKAGFTKDLSKYKVDVDGEVSEYAYNEKVTVTAADDNTSTFSYWKRDGVIVSYDSVYSFYVNGDTTVESVYGEAVAKKAVLAMANPVLVGTDKIAFFAERDIPSDCELIETGILMGTSNELTVENAPIKATAKNMANKGQFTVRKANVKTGDVYYGVAYAIYRDENGTLVTAYSNEVSYEVK